MPPVARRAISVSHCLWASLSSQWMRMRRDAIICLGLAAITLALFWPVSRHEFVNLDDPDYVTENPAVQAGVTWAGVRWAFSGSHASNWHPLTWLSHMLDCQLFGLTAGAH